MSSKLTLSVAPEVVVAAKRYAAAKDTSVSRLVEDYLSLITQQGAPEAGTPAERRLPTPVLERLRGSLRESALDVEAHREHLATKYR